MGMLIAAWMDVRTKPLRTLAAIAGLVAAVVAVILVDAAAEVSHEANEIYLARKYGLPITVSIYSESGLSSGDSARELEEILRSNGVQAFSPATTTTVLLSWQGQRVGDGMFWVNEHYPQIKITDLVAGAWPTDTATSLTLHAVVPTGWADEMLGLGDQQVVGAALALSFDVGGEFDGQTAVLQPVVVDGVISTETNAFTLASGQVIVVSNNPPAALRRSVPAMAWNARINPVDYGMVQELVQSVTDDTGRSVYRMDRSDAGDELAPVLEQQRVTGQVVSLVALTIGGLGILSLGVAGVRERSSEFGLRRALGADRWQIFGAVILQTLMEVLTAALIAIPLATVLLHLFARDLVMSALPLPPGTSLPLDSALLGLGSALAVGIIAGLLPAIYAARASVVQALRT